MTQAIDASGSMRKADDLRLIAGVSAAHFVSHYFILVLPPLFSFVRADYGVSYTEIGLALTAFNGVSAVLQTPAGFLIDRFNARLILAGGLLIGATALAVAASVSSFWVLVVMFGVLGVGNTVYHPADYALLSRHVSPGRMSQAYSIHTFAGLAGGAAAPVTLLFMASQFGWRGAFWGAAALGLIAAVILLLQREPTTDAPASPRITPNTEPAPRTWAILLSPAILVNFVFFMLLALSNFGMQNFSVVALSALHGTPNAVANTALSGHLVAAAVGVLAGGWLASRTPRHTLIAMAGMAMFSAVAFLMAWLDLGSVLLLVAMSVAGFASGALMPSRDLIVRSVTPPGAFGKVFGFVTNGFNIAGIISPLICGALMDHGEPRLVFLSIALFALLAVLTMAAASKSRPV